MADLHTLLRVRLAIASSALSRIKTELAKPDDEVDLNRLREWVERASIELDERPNVATGGTRQ